MRERGTWLWLALLAFLTVGCALAERAWLEAELQDWRFGLVALYSRFTAPQMDTADYVPIAHTGVNPFGINTFLEQEVEEVNIRRSLALIKAAGFGFLRQQFPWHDIERPRQGAYWDERWGVPSWDKYDRIVALAQEYGLQIIARLDYPPEWARPGPWAFGPPDNYEDYGDFVYTVARRYRGRVRYYQIWNEPNLAFEWGQRPPDAREYTRLLQIAYRRAKEADPQSVVLAAALAPTVEMGPENISDLEFLRQMYEAGAKGFFDIASFNPYGLRSGPDDRRLSPLHTNFSRVLLARELMVRYGDAQKPIWASEMGWNALPWDFPAPPTHGRVSRPQQARYTARAYQRALQEWPWMGVMNLWHFRMAGQDVAAQQAYYYGLVDEHFRPYPVYAAVQELATREPTVYQGYHQENHWALRYEGEWRALEDARASGGAYRQSQRPGGRLSFVFQGTDLFVVVGQDGHSGMLEVTIDGSPSLANRLPRRPSGPAYLDLYRPQPQWQAQVPVARGLAPGRHRVEIIVSQARNGASAGHAANLDGLVVRDLGQPPGLRAVALLLLGGLGLGLPALARRPTPAP